MKCLFGFLSIILFGCSAGINKSNVPFEVLNSGQNASIENIEFLLIENNEDYISAIEKLNIDESNYDDLLQVDFKYNNACILFLGQRNTGGYSIEIDYIVKKQKTLYIKTREITPNKNENVTMALTNPYCLISIPKIKKIILK
jgi:hypothetical protein